MVAVFRMYPGDRKALIGVLDALWQGQRVYVRAIRAAEDPDLREVLTQVAKVWDDVIGDIWFRITGLEAGSDTPDLPLIRFRGMFERVAMMAANDNMRLPLASLEAADNWAIDMLQLAATLHATPETRATLLQYLKKIKGASKGRPSCAD